MKIKTTARPPAQTRLKLNLKLKLKIKLRKRKSKKPKLRLLKIPHHLTTQMVKKSPPTSNKTTFMIMLTCQIFSLEIHHKKLELSSIQVLPTLGFLTKTPILVFQKNSHMITKFLPLQRKPSNMLKLILDLEILKVISTQTILESVMKNQVVKSILKTKNSEMLRSNKLFSLERTSRPSLVWLILYLLRKTLPLFSMK